METKHYDDKAIAAVPVRYGTGQPVYYIFAKGRRIGFAQL
jgi:hypothetical protein